MKISSLLTINKERKIPLFFVTVSCTIIGLFFSRQGFAQTIGNQDPHVACTNGCTSKDIKISTAYLVDLTAAHSPLNSNFQCVPPSAEVQLALELSTKTPRVGVFIYANIRNKNTNAILSTVSECFSAPLSSTGTTKVVFNQHFNWPCGTPIILTDVFIGWGTGNTDFCAGLADPRCPATSSKCFALPPGEYITIIVPIGQGASQTKCSTTAGGTTAVFDLTESDATVQNSQTGVHVRWYSDAAGTTELTGTGKTAFTNTSNPQTVYAKVCNDANTNVCSGLQNVVLTVNSKPATPVLSKVDNCDGTSTITAKDGTTTIPSGQLTWSDAGSGNPRSVSNTTALTVTWTVNTCTSATSNSVTPAPKTTPVAPVLSKVDNCDGTTTITAKEGNTTIPSNELTWSNAASGNPITVNNTTAVTATRTIAAGCPSLASNSITPAPGTAPSAPTTTASMNPCTDNTYSVSVQNVGNGTYRLTQPNEAQKTFVVPTNGTSVNFTGLIPGKGYNVTFENTSGCVSGGASCPVVNAAARMRTDTYQTTEQQILVEEQTKVTAYPNPFSNKVKFVVTSAISGKGSLEVYNMLGQKIKSVYQGQIIVGNQIFELNLPSAQRSNLIYVLKVGDRRVTGKLLHLNR